MSYGETSQNNSNERVELSEEEKDIAMFKDVLDVTNKSTQDRVDLSKKVAQTANTNGEDIQPLDIAFFGCKKFPGCLCLRGTPICGKNNDSIQDDPYSWDSILNTDII